MDVRDLFLDQRLGGFKPQDWEGPVTAEAVERAAAEGGFGVRTEMLVKAFHSSGHMGEAATVRTAGGFGTGV